MAEINNTLDANENVSFDAEEMKAAIQAGEAQMPEVDVEAGYEAAKKASVPSENVKQVQGDEVPRQPSIGTLGENKTLGAEGESTEAGNPDQFRSMAHEITSSESQQ